RLRRQVLSPDRHLAAFDLENTLIASNVVASYAWLATRRLSREDRLRFVARTLAEAPKLLALDRRDRSDFLRHFYRRHQDAPTGESRAQVLFDYAAAENLSLAESVAYADSASDLPMLEAVGFPVAVNPETRLAAIARKRGWLVEQFTKAEGAPPKWLPLAPSF